MVSQLQGRSLIDAAQPIASTAIIPLLPVPLQLLNTLACGRVVFTLPIERRTIDYMRILEHKAKRLDR